MNKKHKQIITIVICLCISAIFILSSFAHSGSLDAYGGHYDHSTGEYHYHDGTNTSSGYSSFKEYTEDYFTKEDYKRMFDNLSENYRKLDEEKQELQIKINRYEKQIADFEKQTKGYKIYLYVSAPILVILLFIIISLKSSNKDFSSQLTQEQKDNLHTKSELESQCQIKDRKISELTEKTEKLQDVCTDMAFEIDEYKTMTKSNLNLFPYAAETIAELSAYRAEDKEYIKTDKMYEYKLRYLLELYPQLEEVLNTDYKDLHISFADVDKKSILNLNLAVYPYMAEVMADLQTIKLEYMADSLDWGYNYQRLNKVKSLREIRKETKELLEKYKLYEYQLAYLIELHPELEVELKSEQIQRNIGYDEIFK